MRKFTFFTVLLLVCVLVISGCGKKETLKIGTEATFPPFEFTNDKNEVIGFDIDIAKVIGEKLNKEVEIINMDFSGLVGALNANQIDLAIAGMTITPERKKNVNFSIPYYDASQVIVVRDDETIITTRNDLLGKIIAVQMGTTGADAAAEISNAQIKQFGKVNEAFLELKNKRADAVIIDAPVAKEYIKNISGIKIASKPFTEEQYGIAINKKNTELLEKVNEALNEIFNSGKYQELYDSWFK
ncbi:MAG: basic amino acid ABC transporter substrate-binding protein [Halanaerobiales bacterium]|nr:basic amino acid ABC transporter substrate-binding protein [Halanaerobiales bacterium]